MSFKDTEIGRIPFEWNVRMIQDVAEVVSGATPKTKVAEYWDGNIAWITPKDLSNHTERYIYRGDRMITDEGLKNSSAKLLPKGSVLFSSRAPIGYTAIAAQELCTNQGFKSMICKQQILDNNFMFYMMNYKKNEIENIAGGSTFKEVSGKTVKEFKIPIPPLDEQKAIAKVLSDLDEKIETNNKINKKLEEMAQAIFKQWFVDFEFPCIPENYKFSGAGKPSDFDKVCTYKRVGGLPIPDGHSWFVYILLCEDETFYKGMTNDLYRRFYEHYTGIGAEWTKVHKPIKVIHYEKFNTQEEARKREEELKSGFGREWIKRQYEKYKKCLDTQEMSAGLPAHKTTNNSSFMTAGEMFESELGMIPRGWEVGTFREFTDTVLGGDWGKETEQGNYKKEVLCLRGADIPEIKCGKVGAPAKRFILEKNYNNKKLNSGDLVIEISGGSPTQSTGRITYVNKGILNRYDLDFVCTNFCRAITLNNKKAMEYFYFYWSYLYDLNVFFQYENGTTGIKNFDVNTFLDKHSIIIPSDKILEKYHKIVSNLLSMIQHNGLESFKLGNTRDLLLPKLMSGEIRVPLNNEYN